MDHFYAFMAFVVIFSLEMFAAYSWLAAYYRFGLPVFLTRRGLEQDPGSPLRVVPWALAKSLAEGFKNHPTYPTIQCQAIAPAGQLKGPVSERTEIALHEAMFEPRRGFRYLPVMHSLARLDLARGRVTVSGYIDWYVLFILVYLVVTTAADRSFIPVALLVLVIFVVSYFTQAAIDRAAAEKLASLVSNGGNA